MIVPKSGGAAYPEWYHYAPKATRKVLRAKTFPSIAAVMAEQWGK